ERLHPGQGLLDLGPLERTGGGMAEVADWTQDASEQILAPPARGGRPRVSGGGGQVVGTSALVLWEALAGAYSHLGFDVLGDETFKALVLGRIIEPTSKADTRRVLSEVGVKAPAL